MHSDDYLVLALIVLLLGSFAKAVFTCPPWCGKGRPCERCKAKGWRP